MEEKISVNEYVRTDNGEIHKVIDIEKGSIKIKSNYREWIGLCRIKSHSQNLIDLVEVGDFVNGFPVLEPVYNGNVVYGIDEGYENFRKAFGDIKTILTHEQYDRHCFKELKENANLQ